MTWSKPIEEQAMKAGVRNGLGLTQVSTGLNIDIKKLSDYLEKNPDFLDTLKNQAVMGYQQILSLVNDSAAKKNIGQWSQRKAMLKDFISQVNLWGCHCEAMEVTALEISEALTIYKEPKEMATALSMTLKELLRMVLEDQNLEKYFITKGVTW